MIFVSVCPHLSMIFVSVCPHLSMILVSVCPHMSRIVSMVCNKCLTWTKFLKFQMIWSISNHLNNSELNFNVQNGVRSISKFVGFLLNFRWYLDNHFYMQGLLLFFPGQVRRNCFMCWNKIKTIIATLSAGHQHNSTDHHSDQLKNSKFYKNSSEYANFSKSSGHCVYWIGI